MANRFEDFSRQNQAVLGIREIVHHHAQTRGVPGGKEATQQTEEQQSMMTGKFQNAVLKELLTTHSSLQVTRYRYRACLVAPRACHASLLEMMEAQTQQLPPSLSNSNLL